MTKPLLAKQELENEDLENNTDNIIDIKHGKLLRLQQYFKSISEEISQEILPDIKERRKVVCDIKKVVGDMNGSFKQGK